MELDKAKLVVQEISDVCKRHGVYLVGTCWTEALYSDIQIFEVGAISEWINPYEKATNEVLSSIDNDGTFYVTGIA